MFLLDTNVISELRQGKPQPSPELRAWADSKPATQFFLSAITILELEKGVQALERRTPPQGGALRIWLDAVGSLFTDRILPFTKVTARLCASLHARNPRPERDAMISATALEYGFIVVTRNVSDFDDTGLRVLNPWAPRT